MATTTTRTTRKTKTMVPTDPSTPIAEPKKRGRPRKNSLAPVVLKRSNSTDTKSTSERKSKKGDSVPTIPQPAKAATTEPTPPSKAKTIKAPAKGESNVPTAADNFQAQKAAPEAKSHKSSEDAGSKVQTVVGAAEKFANDAVKAIDSTKGINVEGLQKLMTDTASKGSSESKQQSGNQEIPQGEKTVLLSMLGLTGLWLAFGGKLQKKSEVKQQ